MNFMNVNFARRDYRLRLRPWERFIDRVGKSFSFGLRFVGRVCKWRAR